MAHKILIWSRDAAFYCARLGERFPAMKFLPAKSEAEALAQCGDCDVLLARNDETFDAFVAAMPKLRWIQALTTGTDRIEAIRGLPAHVTVTAVRGFHGPQMSELAFLFMLSFARAFPILLAAQAERRWERRPQRLLVGKTALLVGIGVISEELARRCQAFGMRVIGISASRSFVTGFDAVHPRQKLAEMAGVADFLVVLTHYKEDTRNLIDARVLAAMKPDAVLINLARGHVVDEAALVRALQEGRIAGAALDVFQVEPLPADSPLWEMPNVIVTPHIGGMSDSYCEQVLPILIENVEAYAAGAPARMRYVVNM